MRFMVQGVAVVGLAALLVLSTGACGSGGTTVIVPDASLFSGTYCAGGFTGDEGAVPDEGQAQWGFFNSDGAGSILTSSMLFENTNGVLGGPTSPGAAIPYTVDALRTFTWNLGTPALRGGVSADGSVACLASILAGLDPAMFVMGRKSGTWSNADLAGLYFLCFFAYLNPSDSAIFGTAVLDGAGGVSGGTVMENLDGAPIGPSATMLTYAAAADGSLTGSFFGLAATGAILAGGELILLSGGTVAADDPFLLLLVKAGAGLSNAALNGSYFAVGLEADTGPPPQWTSQTLSLTMDGAGGIAINGGTRSEDGVIFPVPPGVSDYTVAANGALTVETGTFEGGVSPSGNYAIFAGGTGVGDAPTMFFLMR